MLYNYLAALYTQLGSGGSFGGSNTLYNTVLKDKKYDVNKQDVADYIHKISSYTLHSPIKKKFLTQRVIIGGIGELHQSDLMDIPSLMQYNKGYRYILVVIDCFSKKVWLQCLKTKSGDEMVGALSEIYKTTPYPQSLETDGGKEYGNIKCQSFFKRNNVLHIVPYSNAKASIAERVIRTIKSLLWRYLDYNHTYKYYDILSKLADEYNNRYHRSIKMKPNEVNSSNEKAVFNTLYGDLEVGPYVKPHPKFKFGDLVRISKWKHAFHKSYHENYTKEVFRIKEVLNTYVTQYRLTDLHYEDILGKFYQPELVSAGSEQI